MSENKKNNKNITNRFLKFIKNRNILVFFIFFLISAFLWFLNAINKEYTTDIELGLSIKNLPQSMSLLEESNTKLIVTVSGHGYNLLREEIEKVKLPQVIDLKGKKNNVKVYHSPTNCTQAFILTNDLVPSITKRFGDNIKLVKISPDTIYFQVTQTYSRKIKVVPKIEYEVNNDFMQNGSPIVKPDSITVFGPKEIVDTLSGIYTIQTDLGTLGESRIKELKIDFVKNLKYSKSNILIEIPLEKYTENTLEVDVTIINFPDDYIVKLMPEKVKISFKIPLSLFETVSEKDFKAYADFENIQDDQLPITVISENGNIQITSTSPLSVNYIMEQKENEDD